ncbi:Tim44-like domain-containing protein [Clostridium sp. JS66]|uniref:Tim44 domain-containing protein n=1 Tax=Clostridium sp. JS66 TaxID=3064705 RepID=UPI00298E55B2|nr:Tim44-like domain-containing protein [Clostridium sp. JS66]WPC39704.1 Tim44-like domain-containing protein [Clostridium sp. JS66]
MNNIKFRNLIKKVSTVLIPLVVLVINGSTIVFAKSGGGHSGSSHSSSGSFSPGSGHEIDDRIFWIMIFIIFAPIIFSKLILVKRKIQIHLTINKLSNNDSNWNYNHMVKDVEEAFYKVQAVTMERNEELAKEYVSDQLYKKYKLKVEQMKRNKEASVLEEMTLLSIRPIGLQAFEGIEKDYVWVRIKAKLKYYTINEKTGEIIRGEKNRVINFEEYWKFSKSKDRWILCEIKYAFGIDLKSFETKLGNKKS